jgi:hypothetical protein
MAHRLSFRGCRQGAAILLKSQHARSGVDKIFTSLSVKMKIIVEFSFTA